VSRLGGLVGAFGLPIDLQKEAAKFRPLALSKMPTFFSFGFLLWYFGLLWYFDLFWHFDFPGGYSHLSQLFS
jgi:hypothetical protein